MNRTSWETPARTYATGIGDAVADRTVNRKKEDGSIEVWADVAYRVAVGNASLNPEDAGHEFEILHKHLRQASILLSGRHLQHGDATQPTRNQEVFTNCSTAASTFILFYLLLNGSGVGRAYDDDMMLVDWSKNMPYVMPVIRADHPDVLSGEIGPEFVDPVWPLGSGENPGMGAIIFEVPDSREGWAKAIEKIEYATWEATNADKVLLLDFSHVRARGSPIGGMQNRPASGPGPLMAAINSIATLKGSYKSPWLATLYADHYAAECVLVGGARRAARMATKTWRDPSIFEFITCKQTGDLWSSNNSVTVDEEFWDLVMDTDQESDSQGLTAAQLFDEGLISAEALHAHKVFDAICQASYGGGEPGIINVERITQKNDGVEVLFDGNYAESERFKLDDETKQMTAAIAKVFANKKFTQITNPCGEISLSMLGGYCVIADVVPYHAQRGFHPASDCTVWDDDTEEAFRAAVRALLRVNLMDCLYGKEVKRTNRIGVGFTGLHEYAWARFGFGWKDLVDENKSIEFWRAMGRFSNACVDEAARYSEKLGTSMPHTVTTVKPAGTTSKLFGLTEGAHLPSMRQYLRWVQFRSDDPLVEKYRAAGYPVRENLKTYKGTTIVGFPTTPEIVALGMGDKLVTAAEATPEEQYEYLRLLEKWWIDGYSDELNRQSRHVYGNQVSYTLKYRQGDLNFAEFRRTLLEGQSTVKCCSVMPEGDPAVTESLYEYLPEEPVTEERFTAIVDAITVGLLKEDIGLEHVDCGSGACPINFNDEKVA